MNDGAIPVSAEELSQRYTNLFQQYSRLKAQHAALKKAVIKEQASNVALQGNVKEKEKELRKLQEQLDLLSFHNERLTKRILAVQESDKIQENERLHEELTERQFEFTNNINRLLKQIQDLEERIKELETEDTEQINNSTLLESGTPEFPNDDSKEKEEEEEQLLRQKIDELKADLDEKTRLLREQEEKAKEDDKHLLSEIHSLRTILLVKLGNVKNTDVDGNDALMNLEKEAENYIQSIRDTKDVQEALPHEIAEKLMISHDTWIKELEKLTVELENKKRELNEELAKQGEMDEYEDEIKRLNEEHQERVKQLNEEHEKSMMQLSAEHEVQLNEHLAAKEEIAKRVGQLEEINEKLEKENKRLRQEIEQMHTNRQPTIDNETQTEIDNKEEDEEVFIYPKKDEEENEVFVYTGMDALPTKEEKKKEEEDAISMLMTSYDQQINELTKKLQDSDSNAARLGKLYETTNDKLLSEEKEKQTMMLEIEKLNEQVRHAQDLLTTTKTNYQKQVDDMTEMITMLQSS
ncbi:hypothetical protein RO3G_09354 [Rhizopus delemar RA 99-880]|uniref:Protein phosphatase 1 regulatory subunit 21 N-terminal domain-containing protein n=1 Tax=Rhizopus delemar (strain RA 99-880 / ATCC MYA-4621 / FGSC 9543 / NRRL 43880) TaxID=246409 RepID=I1C864_RHIO9|nr:hypothetical protein RO3G_09354 [Rhizopus delemar RA 99-880]|eukprot:EIE84644.1 hypothetical protein RO3G_09354 [Rhizopus delemar RA 99-880]